jgi:hypothetical protein
MPTIPIQRGATANFGANIVHNNITLNGVGAGYSVTIGPMPAVIGVAAPGVPIVFAVNNQAVSVTNTTPPPGPTNLQITY